MIAAAYAAATVGYAAAERADELVGCALLLNNPFLKMQARLFCLLGLRGSRLVAATHTRTSRNGRRTGSS